MTEWLCMGFGEIKKPTDFRFENQSAMYLSLSQIKFTSYSPASNISNK